MKVKKILIFLISAIIFLVIFLISNQNNTQKQSLRDNSFLTDDSFSEKLIESELYYSKANSYDDIFNFNREFFMKVDKENITNINLEILSQLELFEDTILPVTQIEFKFQNNKYKSFSYGKIKRRNKAILIIPGSGTNQSSKIFLNDKNNYHHGLKSELEKDFDIFVFIKPNEDFLSLHNGKNKINYDYIFNWHINNGGSYSYSYIVQSIALTEYLKKNYNKVVVAGLSQGGEAAFFNSIFSEPDFSIISSGLSLIDKKVEYSSRDQIIIPNKFIYDKKILKENFDNLNTSFFLSWGMKDSSPEYIQEAKNMKTCNFYKNLFEIKCFAGDKHEFPVKQIINFLNEK